jgi:molybdopterin/thiamine biosynthesis adenylyltransferase
MNRAAVALRKPMVECAMYAMDVHVTTILPGRSPCLQCIVPTVPPEWKRQFPVLGAVSGVAGSIGAVEVVKLLTGVGTPLAGKLLVMHLDTHDTRRFNVLRDPNCLACSKAQPPKP